MMSKTSGGSGWAVGVVLAFAAACSLGDGATPDFSSFGGTDANPTTGGAEGDDDDGSSAGKGEGQGSTAAVDGGSNTATTTGVTTAEDSTGDDDVTTSTTDGGATTDPTTGGGESSSGGGESSSGGVMPGDDYEACTPDDTCDTPGEICLQVGAGGFCTNTCGSDAECPPTPPGTALTASCEFLLGFPDFAADYCGMIGCDFIFNDCPAGMTCTPVVMGLTVCEWV